MPSALLLEGVAIDAPTGLGKSNAFFKTQLLEPDPGVDYVTTDNKGDGWTQTAAALSRTHDCYRLDMQNPANSVTWAPLSLVRTPAKAEDWARAWLHNSKPADSAPPQPYFEQAVLLLMAAGVMHVHAVAAAAGRPSGTLDELLALLLQPNVEAIERALKKGPSGAETGPAAQFLGLIAEHRDLRSSIPSGLAPRLSALADPAIKAVVGGQGALDLDRLGRTKRRPVALYIVIPAGDDTLRPLVAALFTTMFTVLLDRARTLPNGELAREVRMLLDEFGTMGAIPNAPKWFNICRQPKDQPRHQLPVVLAARGRLRGVGGQGHHRLVQRAGLAGRDARGRREVGERGAGQPHGAGPRRGRNEDGRAVRPEPRSGQPVGERDRRAPPVP